MRLSDRAIYSLTTVRLELFNIKQLKGTKFILILPKHNTVHCLTSKQAGLFQPNVILALSNRLY